MWLTCLPGPCGVLPSYAGRRFAAMVLSPFDIISNDLKIRGFSMDNPALSEHGTDASAQAASMVAAGEVPIPVTAERTLRHRASDRAHGNGRRDSLERKWQLSPAPIRASGVSKRLRSGLRAIRE
jgi:hypothetical protein